MKTRIFKNNNVRIKREAWYDDKEPVDIFELLEMMNNDIDAPDVLKYEEGYPWGYATLFVNGAPRLYPCGNGEVGAFNAGKTVYFNYEDDAPLFTLPDFFKFDSFEFEGRKGTLYTLCKEPSAEQWEEMSAAGCERYRVQAQYAPELVHTAVFVPAGTPFEFA